MVQTEHSSSSCTLLVEDIPPLMLEETEDVNEWPLSNSLVVDDSQSMSSESNSMAMPLSRAIASCKFTQNLHRP